MYDEFLVPDFDPTERKTIPEYLELLKENKMTKVYKVGDWVWYATYESEEIKVPCPVCYGNKVVTVILGNGDEVAVECDYCGKGWQNALGYVTDYQRNPKAEQQQITKRRIEDGRDGEEIE